jgi:hypothetical protein
MPQEHLFVSLSYSLTFAIVLSEASLYLGSSLEIHFHL